jgi:rapamycin-insensitive companion of mTOR
MGRAVLIDIDLVYRTGGIRVLLHALGEGPAEMGSMLVSIFLYIVDSPRTRAYLRVGTDLEVMALRFLCRSSHSCYNSSPLRL